MLNGPLSKVQWQALGKLGNKLQPLWKGLEELKQSITSPTKKRGIRVGLEVCRTMECWAGKLRGEACPPCWANAGVYKQASDSHCNLATQP